MINAFLYNILFPFCLLICKEILSNNSLACCAVSFFVSIFFFCVFTCGEAGTLYILWRTNILTSVKFDLVALWSETFGN